METQAAAACGDDDPTAVGVGEVVEAKETPGTPTKRRASALAVHGLDLDSARGESRSAAEESVASFFGSEAGGSPRREIGQRNKLWGLTDLHGEALSGDGSRSLYHM